MMNNQKGFAKHEVLTIFAIIIIGFAIGLNFIVNSGNKQKTKTMKSSAQIFASVVASNTNGFDVYFNEHYLDEVVDNKLMKDIKSPFGGKFCDGNESKVGLENDKVYVTLKCGDRLIEHTSEEAIEEAVIYKVTQWSDTKRNGSNQERTVYNCINNNKEVFDRYLEEVDFIYNVNKKYNQQNTSIENIKESCKVKSKTVYRTKTALKE